MAPDACVEAAAINSVTTMRSVCCKSAAFGDKRLCCQHVLKVRDIRAGSRQSASAVVPIRRAGGAILLTDFANVCKQRDCQFTSREQLLHVSACSAWRQGFWTT